MAPCTPPTNRSSTPQDMKGQVPASVINTHLVDLCLRLLYPLGGRLVLGVGGPRRPLLVGPRLASRCSWLRPARSSKAREDEPHRTILLLSVRLPSPQRTGHIPHMHTVRRLNHIEPSSPSSLGCRHHSGRGTSHACIPQGDNQVVRLTCLSSRVGRVADKLFLRHTAHCSEQSRKLHTATPFPVSLGLLHKAPGVLCFHVKVRESSRKHSLQLATNTKKAPL